MRRPTMTDVARLAGVSQSSVSLVLNEMTGARIAESTRERVIRAARQIQYTLPSQRKGHREGDTKNTIAFVIDEISTSPHAVVTLDGVRDFSWEAGYLVESYVTRSNEDLEAATLSALLQAHQQLLGVIYATIFTRQVVLPKALEETPTVLLNCYEKPSRFASIVPAEVIGGFTATEYLISKGHKRIGFINGEKWMDASTDRLKGYRQALARHGIVFDQRLLRHGDWLPFKGYQLAQELLALSPRPTALFCANDLMAMGALEAAAELGLNVPGELSVMGYDDQELARYTHPPLTTLVLPNYEMGRRAAELLIASVTSGKPIRGGTLEIDGPIVERESVTAYDQDGVRDEQELQRSPRLLQAE